MGCHSWSCFATAEGEESASLERLRHAGGLGGGEGENELVVERKSCVAWPDGYVGVGSRNFRIAMLWGAIRV